MKFFIFWLCMALSLALSLAAPAEAQDLSSFYVTPKIMSSYQKADMNEGYERSSVFGLGLSVGTDLSYSSSLPIRLEVEYLFHGNETYTQTGVSTHDLSAHSLLGNVFFDLQTDTAFTPYIGGGAGFACLNDRATVANVTSKGNRWNFAWDAGGGVAWGLSERLALDLGYRYMDLGESNDITSGNRNYNVSLTAHEFSVGLRFTGF